MTRLKRNLLICCAALLVLAVPAFGQDAGRPQRSGDARQAGAAGPRQSVPGIPAAEPVDAILGRPTDTSVNLSLLRRDRDASAFVVYAPEAGGAPRRTAEFALRQGEPRDITLEKLRPDTRYAYEVRDGQSGKAMLKGRVHTQRLPGASFRFTITADSHLDQNTEPALYRRTLANVAADAPDFHVDLGDTFMTAKHESREHASQHYLAQRAYFGMIGNSTPLYLVLGNHDGEERRLLRDGADSLAVWANGMRKRYFPNPVPDAFYTGNARQDPWAGQLQDYYAWHWGDALFVVLNPYWHGSGRRGDERWDTTLGDLQYRWLRQTLERSRARYKFVFVHQLIGGRDRQGRGGVEAVEFGEWGGMNADGSEGFRAHRPGWELPVHPLLVRHGVSAVFHGHDHLYARQERDGVVYQAVPQPGHPGQGVPRFAAEYGYRSGTILGGSGHIRVTVSPAHATVEFVRVRTDRNADAAGGNGPAGHAYTILAGR